MIQILIFCIECKKNQLEFMEMFKSNIIIRLYISLKDTWPSEIKWITKPYKKISSQSTLSVKIPLTSFQVGQLMDKEKSQLTLNSPSHQGLNHLDTPTIEVILIWPFLRRTSPRHPIASVPPRPRWTRHPHGWVPSLDTKVWMPQMWRYISKDLSYPWKYDKNLNDMWFYYHIFTIYMVYPIK